MSENNESVKGPLWVQLTVDSGKDGATIGEPQLRICGTIGGCECSLTPERAWRALTDDQKTLVISMFEVLRSDLRRLQWNPILKD